MATIFLQVSNNKTSSLNLSVNASITTFIVLDSTQFPTTYPFQLSIENEIVQCTNNNTGTNTLTVIRGQEGTTAAIHGIGIIIGMRITAKHFSDAYTAINALEASSVWDRVDLGGGSAYINPHTTTDRLILGGATDDGNSILQVNGNITTSKVSLAQVDAAFFAPNNHISVPDISSYNFGTGDFTFSWWQYKSSNPGGGAAIMLSPNGSWAGMILGLDDGGTSFDIYMSSNGGSWDISVGNSLGTTNDDAYHFYTITRNGSTFTAYMDGVQQSTWTSSASIYHNSSGLFINAGSTYGEQPNVIMEELQIYNIGMSGAQVTALYNSGNGQYGSSGLSGLIAGFHMTGSTPSAYVNDYSTHANNGSWTGTPTSVAGKILSGMPTTLFNYNYSISSELLKIHGNAEIEGRTLLGGVADDTLSILQVKGSETIYNNSNNFPLNLTYQGGNIPSIGYNAFWDGSQWVYGVGSSGNYASMMQSDPGNGGLSWLVSTGTGNAGDPISFQYGIYVTNDGRVLVHTGSDDTTSALQVSGQAFFQGSGTFVYINDGTYGVNSQGGGGGKIAGRFYDGFDEVWLGDGSYALNVKTGSGLFQQNVGINTLPDGSAALAVSNNTINSYTYAINATGNITLNSQNAFTSTLTLANFNIYDGTYTAANVAVEGVIQPGDGNTYVGVLGGELADFAGGVFFCSTGTSVELTTAGYSIKANGPANFQGNGGASTIQGVINIQGLSNIASSAAFATAYNSNSLIAMDVLNSYAGFDAQDVAGGLIGRLVDTANGAGVYGYRSGTGSAGLFRDNNSNQVNIADGIYSLNITGNVLFQSGGIMSSAGIFSIDPIGRQLFANDGSTIVMDWSNTNDIEFKVNLQIDPTFRILGDGGGGGTYNSIDTNNRLLIANDGGTTNLDWNTPSVVKLPPYTSNGFVKTSAANGTLIIDTNTYPSVVSSANGTTQGAAVGTTGLFTPSANGMYRISIYLQITRAASTSSILGGATGVVITYNDGDGNVTQTDTVALASTAGTIVTTSATNTTATNLVGTLPINARTGSSVSFAIGYTSVGVTSMQYSYHIVAEKLF